MSETCEMCGRRKGAAVVVDDNYETWLCKPCRTELKEQCEVELIRPR